MLAAHEPRIRFMILIPLAAIHNAIYDPESPHRFDEREVNIHYRSPVRQLMKDGYPATDQLDKFQRDLVC